MNIPEGSSINHSRQYAELKAASEDELSATCFHLANRFLESNPKHAGALYHLATHLVNMARYAEAEAAFLQILEICSDDERFMIYTELGHLHRQRLAPQLAEEWYRRAIEAAPSIQAGHVFLGALFAIQGRLDEAEACYRRALTCLDGDPDEVHYNLASVLRAQGKYEESLSEARAALSIDPKYEYAKHLIKDLLKVLPEENKD